MITSTSADDVLKPCFRVSINIRSRYRRIRFIRSRSIKKLADKDSLTSRLVEACCHRQKAFLYWNLEVPQHSETLKYTFGNELKKDLPTNWDKCRAAKLRLKSWTPNPFSALRKVLPDRTIEVKLLSVLSRCGSVLFRYHSTGSLLTALAFLGPTWC